MIKCTFFKHGFFEKFTITGHSLFDKKGKDIICAAVSTVSQHTARFLAKKGAKVKIKEGYLKVDNIRNDENSQLFVEELLETLRDLEEQYSKFIKVEVKNDEN
ncbi:MAG: ribosomal-processing cysteine protease Prp [Thermosipho sp. (in: Bacteria)]|nr:ribosomal-processing cysteine protease Prp [Thermosipho sp. (in: thermotogales)]